MGKFQRLLTAAENEIDDLDRSVLLAFEVGTSMPTRLEKRWPNAAPATSHPTIESMEYLVADRIQSAQARGAFGAQELFKYLADVLRKIRDDDAGLAAGPGWP